VAIQSVGPKTASVGTPARRRHAWRRNRWPGRGGKRRPASTNCASVVSPARFRTRHHLPDPAGEQAAQRLFLGRTKQDDAGLEPKRRAGWRPRRSVRQPLLGAAVLGAGADANDRQGKVQGLESCLADAAGFFGAVEQNGRGGAATRGGFRSGAIVRVVEGFRGAGFAGTRRGMAAVSRNPRPSRRYPMRCGMPARRATSAASKELGSRIAASKRRWRRARGQTQPGGEGARRGDVLVAESSRA